MHFEKVPFVSVTNRVWWGRDSSIVDAISLGIRDGGDRGNVDLDEENNCLAVSFW